jgi:hypothetical protein
MALGSTQPLTELSTRSLPGVKGRSAHKADNLTAISEPLVSQTYEPPRPATGIGIFFLTLAIMFVYSIYKLC